MNHRQGNFTCISVELFNLHATLLALLDSATEQPTDLIFASSMRLALKGAREGIRVAARDEGAGKTLSAEEGSIG